MLNQNGAASISAAYAMNIGDETDYTYTSWGDYINTGKTNGYNPLAGCEVFDSPMDGAELVVSNPGNYIIVIRYVLDNGETYIVQQPGVVTATEDMMPKVTLDGDTFTLSTGGMVVTNVYLMNSGEKSDFTYKTFTNYAAYGKSNSFGAYNPKRGYDYFKSIADGSTYTVSYSGYYNVLIKYTDPFGNDRLALQKCYVE